VPPAVTPTAWAPNDSLGFVSWNRVFLARSLLAGEVPVELAEGFEPPTG
jgi:hypothetical protein